MLAPKESVASFGPPRCRLGQCIRPRYQTCRQWGKGLESPSRHLASGRLLPVFPWKRTSSGPVAMSQKCQNRKSRALFNHLIGLREERRRNCHAERFCCLQIDHELELSGLNDRQICRLCAFKNPSRVDTDLMIRICNTRSITHQTANGGGFPKLVNRRQGVTRRQRDELIASAE